MSPLLLSLGAGVFIGLVYALLNVRSPAPPAIALVGLLGMIIGTQIVSPAAHPNATLSDRAKPAAPVGIVKEVG